MSTIASLLGMLGDTQIRPWDIATRSQNEAETGLIELQQLKAKQQAEQEFLLSVKNDPRVREALFGGSVLGSLGPAGGLPAPGGQPPGAITQSPLGGGPAQQIPAYPDASRYAGVSPQGGGPLPAGVGMPTVTPPGAPQSVIGSLGPAGQPQAPQQNPLLAMAAQNPRAAMMLQGQMEQRQDANMKRQEQHLKLGAATLGYVGQQAQGVTDQASLDALRSDLQSQGLGKYAAQLPQLYSKEAMAPFIAKAIDVKESLTLQVQSIAAQAELKRAQMAGRVASTDQYLKALGVTPGTEQPEDMQRALELQNKHLAEIEAGKVNAQIVPGPGGEYWMVNPRTGERRPVGGGGSSGGTGGAGTGSGGAGTDEQLRAPMTEGQAKTAGYTSRMQSGQEQLNTLEKSGDYATWKLPLTQLPGGRLLLSGKQKEYENAKGIFLAGLLRYDSAGQITEAEWKYYGDLYFPQYGDEPAQVEQKRQHREQAIKTHQEMLGRPVPGQKPEGQSGSQSSTGTGGQAGGNTFNDADIATTMANPRNKGKTRQQIVDGLLAKGMTYK